MVTPAELWQESGRWQKYGPELLRLKVDVLLTVGTVVTRACAPQIFYPGRIDPVGGPAAACGMIEA